MLFDGEESAAGIAKDQANSKMEHGHGDEKRSVQRVWVKKVYSGNEYYVNQFDIWASPTSVKLTAKEHWESQKVHKLN